MAFPIFLYLINAFNPDVKIDSFWNYIVPGVGITLGFCNFFVNPFKSNHVLGHFYATLFAIAVFVYIGATNGYPYVCIFVVWMTLIMGGFYITDKNLLILFFIIIPILLLLSFIFIDKSDTNTWEVLFTTIALNILMYFPLNQRIKLEEELLVNQRELVHKTEELELTLNSFSAIICYKDIHNKIIKVNEAYAKFVGRKVENLNGKYLEELIPEDLAANFHKRDLEILRTGNPEVGVIEKVITISGHTKYMLADVMPHYNAQKEIIGLVIYGTDITDQIEAETKLRESEERFRRVFQDTQYALIITNIENKVIEANKAALQMFGYTAEEFKEFDAGLLNHPDTRNVGRDAFWQTIADGKDSFKQEKRFVTKSGLAFLGSLSAVIRRDALGNPFQTIEVIEDITLRRKAELQLKSYAAKLERTNKSLEEFAYIASHDLREPLRSIVSYTQLLERRSKGLLNEDTKTYMDFIIKGSKRMNALINSLLEYSRAGLKEEYIQDVNLTLVLEDVKSNLRTQITENKATIVEDDMPIIRAQKEQLVILFQNLITNAIKYRSEKRHPVVTIVHKSSEDQWEFEVRDNGIGIEDEYLERIFAVFKRLHKVDDFEGTGIGLAICRRIVYNYGGKIWATSKHGQGTSFFFTIPKKQEDYKLQTEGAISIDE